VNNNNGKSKEAEIDAHFIAPELYEGEVRLKIKSSEDYKQVDQFSEYLKMVENLEIASYNWSEHDGLMMVVSLQSPMPLGIILSQISIVKQVYQKHHNIITVLNTSMVDQTPVVAT
jgi:RNAse (barnase) inhibitor barstar